jgi:hypothetical protein
MTAIPSMFHIDAEEIISSASRLFFPIYCEVIIAAIVEMALTRKA